MRYVVWIVLAVVGLAGCGGAPGPEQRESGTDGVDGAVSRVEIEVDAGDVRLVAGPSSSVTRELRWTGSAKPVVEQRLDGDVLRVTARCSRGVGDRCEADLTVTVPSAAAARTQVGAGDVTVEGLTGVLDLDTAAGDVRGTGIGPAEVRARSAGGDVELAVATAAPSVTAATTAGDVVVRVPAGPSYSVAARTTAGDVRVDVADTPGAAHRVDAASTAGDVTVTQGP